MQPFLYIIYGSGLIYLLLSLVLTYLAQEYPRKPYKDGRFPLEFALNLKACFPPRQAELFVAENAHHRESSLDPGYPDAVRGFMDRYLNSTGYGKSSP